MFRLHFSKSIAGVCVRGRYISNQGCRLAFFETVNYYYNGLPLFCQFSGEVCSSPFLFAPLCWETD